MTDKENKYDSVLNRTARRSRDPKQKRIDKILNYLIALVLVLIGISLFIIFTTEDNENMAEPQQPVQSEQTPDPVNEPVTEQTDDVNHDENYEATSEENVDLSVQNENDDEASVEVSTEKVVIETVNEGNVVERWTSSDWKPYTTAQEGPHASVYEEGHIDYEEKIAAVYSVIPLDRESSILVRIQNNGSAQSAKAIIMNTSKTEIYQVYIKWVDGAGWQPTTVEVLSSLEEI